MQRIRDTLSLPIIFSSVFFQTFGLSVVSFLLPENFKIYFACVCILFVLLVFLHKQIFLPLLLLLFVLLQFQAPGKGYSFILIPTGNYSYEQEGFDKGITEGYSLIMSDFFAIWITLYIFRMIVRRLQKSFSISWFEKIIHSHLLLFLPLFLLFFSFLFSGMGSVYYSFYPFFSLIVWAQHLKIIVLFIITLVFLQQRSGKSILVEILLGIVFFQILLGGFQILGAVSSVGSGSGFKATYAVPDESELSFRINGTFAYANQFAFILGLLTFSFLSLLLWEKQYVVFPTSLREYSIWAIILSCFIGIMVSQSRVMWGILLLMGVLFRKEIVFFLASGVKKLRENTRFLLFSILFFELIILLILPRFFASLLFFSEEGGGGLRFRMIRDGLQVLAGTPLFGYGVESSIYQLFQQIPNGYIYEFPFAIHNAYLQLAIEQGIIGSILFFSPFILLLRWLITQEISPLEVLSTTFCILSLLTVILYYSLHPSYGRVEFPFLGIMLAIVTSKVYGIQRKQNL